MKDIQIRCPKCSWEPDGKPYWACTCGTVWDTFSTGGRCPGCGKQWEDTQCVPYAGGCGKWSPHLDWYDNLSEIANQVNEFLKAPEEVELQQAR